MLRNASVISVRNRRIRRAAAVIALTSAAYLLGYRAAEHAAWPVTVEYVAPAVRAPGPDYMQPADAWPTAIQS